MTGGHMKRRVAPEGSEECGANGKCRAAVPCIWHDPQLVRLCQARAKESMIRKRLRRDPVYRSVLAATVEAIGDFARSP